MAGNFGINRWQRVVLTFGAAALLLSAYHHFTREMGWTTSLFLGTLLLVAAFMPAPVDEPLWPIADMKRAISIVRRIVWKWRSTIAVIALVAVLVLAYVIERDRMARIAAAAVTPCTLPHTEKVDRTVCNPDLPWVKNPYDALFESPPSPPAALPSP